MKAGSPHPSPGWILRGKVVPDTPSGGKLYTDCILGGQDDLVLIMFSRWFN